MSDDSAMGAIERLERALHRVEAATARLRSKTDQQGLAARHRQLQNEVEAAIHDLDRLIGTAEAG